jgi:hypothetical protein
LPLRAPGGLAPFDGAPPAAVVAGTVAQTAVVGGLSASVVLLLLGRLPWLPRFALAALLGALAGAAGGVGREMLAGGLLGASAALLALLFGRVAGASLWAPAVAIGGALLLGEGGGLLRGGAAGWYLANGIVVLALGVAAVVWLLVGWPAARRAAAPAAESGQ